MKPEPGFEKTEYDSKHQFTLCHRIFKPFFVILQIIYDLAKKRKDALRPRVAGGGYAASVSSLALDYFLDRETRGQLYVMQYRECCSFGDGYAASVSSLALDCFLDREARGQTFVMCRSVGSPLYAEGSVSHPAQSA